MANVSSINCIIIIKNGSAAKLNSVVVPYSKLNINILDIFVRERIVEGFKIGRRSIHVFLLNSEVVSRKLRNVRILSKPSRPVYVTLRVLKEIHRRLGSAIESLTILSTPIGVLTIEEALHLGTGGEVLVGANSFILEAISLSE